MRLRNCSRWTESNATSGAFATPTYPKLADYTSKDLVDSALDRPSGRELEILVVTTKNRAAQGDISR
jgi:hypothetical protein